MIRKIAIFCIAVAPIVTGVAHAQNVLTHHMREAVSTGEAAPIGRLPATQTMTLDLVLPLSDSTGLTNFLSELYNPASANYRQFLTPAQFTERFGPPQQDYETLVKFAKASVSPSSAARATP